MAQSTKESTKSSLISPLQTPTIPTNYLSNFHPQQRITVENFIILWLDTNINVHDDNYQSTITYLQHHVHFISYFTDPDQCLDFLTEIKTEKIFLLISGSLGNIIVPLIRNLDQIDSIYIYPAKTNKHENWAKKEKKVKGFFIKPQSIRDAIRRDIRQCDDDLASINILSSTYHTNEKLNPSDQLFIYIQLLKEILIEIDYQPNKKTDFAEFCRLQYGSNNYQLRLIKEFSNDYQQSSSIWWYTRECFINSMLNKAFRIRDMEILPQIGFFIRDIHQDIKRLHSKVNKQNRLTVYRGQGISEDDFHKILDNRHGFLSFDNFLTTTTDKDTSLIYARSARDNHELIGILFHMEIDRSKSLFTPLAKISYDPQTDRDILFSIKTIFRLRDIQQIENGLWLIKLGLTTDENEQLNHINELIRKEIKGQNGLDILIRKLHPQMEIKPIVEEDVRDETIQPMVTENTEVEHSPTVNNTVNEQPANTLYKESEV